MTTSDLTAAGIDRMTETEIHDFLASQGTGVLGLPSTETPYLLPLSYGYDEDTLYFTYLRGASSRKESLSESAGSAAFLVYTASSPFQWQSVLLEGTIERIEDDDPAHDESVGNPWRPAVFDRIELPRGVQRYAFRIQDRSGLKHTGLPPAMETGEFEGN